MGKVMMPMMNQKQEVWWQVLEQMTASTGVDI